MILPLGGHGSRHNACQRQANGPRPDRADATDDLLRRRESDVGKDDATPVTEDYKERDNRFTGTIQKVTVALHAANAQSADQEVKKNAAHKKALSD